MSFRFINILLGCLLFNFIFIYPLFTTVSQEFIPIIRMVSSSEYPGPHESITISLRSGTKRLSEFSSVQWFVNGKRIATENKKTTIDITLGDLGEKTTITIKITHINGNVYTISKNILPFSFDVLYEGDVYTPTGYRGRNVPAPQSRVRAVVLINYIDENGRKYTEKDFSIEWGVNDFPVRQNSLDSSSVYIGPFDYITSPGRVVISVYAVHGNEKFFIKKVDYVDIYGPEIVLYENHPLYGLSLESSLANNLRINSPTNISALPFFFDKQDVLNGKIFYSWEEDRGVILEGVDAQYLHLNPFSGKKQASFTITARNESRASGRKYLQSGVYTFRVSV